MSSSQLVNLLGIGLWETLYMTLVASLFAYIIGVPLGIMLTVWDKDGIHPIVPVQRVIGVIVNIFRSAPFLILMIAITPFTRALIGTGIGTEAAIIALIVAAAPYVARLVESSLREVDKGVIEAAKSMGSSTVRIIMKVMLPEARPSLLVGVAIAVTTILSYSAMSGILGGGGLGNICIQYGYYRNNNQLMIIPLIIIIIIVQVLQELGLFIARTMDKRR